MSGVLRATSSGSGGALRVRRNAGQRTRRATPQAEANTTPCLARRRRASSAESPDVLRRSERPPSRCRRRPCSAHHTGGAVDRSAAGSSTAVARSVDTAGRCSIRSPGRDVGYRRGRAVIARAVPSDAGTRRARGRARRPHPRPGCGRPFSSVSRVVGDVPRPSTRSAGAAGAIRGGCSRVRRPPEVVGRLKTWARVRRGGRATVALAGRTPDTGPGEVGRTVLWRAPGEAGDAGRSHRDGGWSCIGAGCVTS